MHPELREIMCSWGGGDGMILETSFNKPFSEKGFSNYMADRISISKADLPDRCVTHGLRKAAARRHAEAGCSANEIASITGHVTLDEVARYTRAAEQKKLARAAIECLASAPNTIKVPNASFGPKRVDWGIDFTEENGGWRTQRGESSKSLLAALEELEAQLRECSQVLGL
jgi:hypothetical protein